MVEFLHKLMQGMKRNMEIHHKKSPSESEDHVNFIDLSVYVQGGRDEMKFTEADKLMLMFSSLFFLVPGVYGVYVAEYAHGIFSMTASVVSLMYWIQPGNSWRLTLDLTVSKLLGLFYAVTGIYCCSSISQWEVIAAFPLVFLMVGGYAMSNHLWTKKSACWVFFHFGFHFFGSWSQLNTIFVLQHCFRVWWS